MRARQILMIAGITLLVSACSEFYSIAPRSLVKTAGNVNMISTGVTMATDKTLMDHIVSYRSGKDCSTVRKELGRTYCVEDEPNPIPAVHCYPSLGDVTCYANPDPNRSLQSRVGNTQ